MYKRQTIAAAAEAAEPLAAVPKVLELAGGAAGDEPTAVEPAPTEGETAPTALTAVWFVDMICNAQEGGPQVVLAC